MISSGDPAFGGRHSRRKSRSSVWLTPLYAGGLILKHRCERKLASEESRKEDPGPVSREMPVWSRSTHGRFGRWKMPASNARCNIRFAGSGKAAERVPRHRKFAIKRQQVLPMRELERLGE